MNLRIIAGSLRGRSIRIRDKQVSFRPTLERARQSIADMLTPMLPGCRGVDLCAGSGAFGFEMISRGAATVDFIENDHIRAATIRENANALGIIDRCRIIVQEAAEFAAAEPARYDVVFFDPPYDDTTMAALVSDLIGHLNPGGILLYQRRRRRSPAQDRSGPLPDQIKTFGDTEVEVYRARTGETAGTEQ